jgi:hypothetical protein
MLGVQLWHIGAGGARGGRGEREQCDERSRHPAG